MRLMGQTNTSGKVGTCKTLKDSSSVSRNNKQHLGEDALTSLAVKRRFLTCRAACLQRAFLSLWRGLFGDIDASELCLLLKVAPHPDFCYQSQLSSLITKLHLRAIDPLVCCGSPFWDEQMCILCLFRNRTLHSTRPCPKVLSQSARLWESAHCVFSWFPQRCQRFWNPGTLWTSLWSHHCVLAHYFQLTYDLSIYLPAFYTGF